MPNKNIYDTILEMEQSISESLPQLLKLYEEALNPKYKLNSSKQKISREEVILLINNSSLDKFKEGLKEKITNFGNIAIWLK